MKKGQSGLKRKENKPNKENSSRGNAQIGQAVQKVHSRNSFNGRLLLLVLVIVLLLVSLFNAYIYYSSVSKLFMPEKEPEKLLGFASSGMNFCINRPPFFNLGNCSSLMDEEELYECQLPTVDSENDTLTYSISFITSVDLFTITPGGLISFTPGNNSPGNHTANLTINDGMNCSNSIRSYEWDIEVANINDPPYLNMSIPNIIANYNVLTYAFNLNDYFKDPDDDPLTFILMPNLTYIDLDIHSDGSVYVYSVVCISETTMFNASDPFNLSALSNPVTITINCDDDDDDDDDDDQGGGGGGGGGSSSPDCIPNWVCHPWGPCQKNGTRVRVCEDAAGCEDEKYYYYENCTYYPPRNCTPEWECTNWTTCSINNTQTRQCLDMKFCDDKSSMPETIRSCIYIPTCNDGVKNGLETGVDCGGNCPPCKIVEMPKFLEDEENKLWIILVSSLLALFIILVVLYKIFHKEISRFLIKLGWRLAGKYHRVLLLKKHDADDLLKKILTLEKKIDATPNHEKEISNRSLELAALTRLFFEKALGVPYEFREAELIKKLGSTRIKTSSILKKIFIEFFRSVNYIEFGKRASSLEELNMLLEELRQFVYAISEKGLGKYKEVKESRIAGSGAKGILLKLADVEIALQYEELIAAQNKFLEVINAYEAVPEQDKALLDQHISRVNKDIRYIKGLITEQQYERLKK